MNTARDNKVSRRLLSMGIRIAASAFFCLSVCLLGSCAGTAQGGNSTDIEMGAFERGAAPGGITDSWIASDGTEVVLSDDGSATMSGGQSAATKGFWRQTDATQGEILLDDGRTLGLRLSGDDLTLYDPAAPDVPSEVVLHRKSTS